MKFSMHNWMRPEPIETTLERLHRLGYDGIEITGEPARTILCIVPSVVGKTKPMASPAQEWKWVVEGLKEVTDYALKYGVLCGVEPLNRFETYIINRHDQALRLAEDVGNDLRVVLDAFHINIEEHDPMQAIRNTGSRLLDFHVADNNRRPAGQGTYDWKVVLDTLKSAGYQGHLTAEFVLHVDRSPLAIIGEKREADMQFTEADLKFIQDLGSGLIPAADYDRAVLNNITHLKKILQSSERAARQAE